LLASSLTTRQEEASGRLMCSVTPAVVSLVSPVATYIEIFQRRAAEQAAA